MNSVRAILYSAIISAAKLLTGLVAIKIIALNLGPEALGLVGQFMSVIAILVVLSTGGVSIGITRYTAERIFDRQGTSRLLKTASLMGAVVCIIIMIATLFYAPNFSIFLFGSEDFAWTLTLSSFLLLPLWFSGFGQAVINGLSDIAALAKVHLGSAILGSLGFFAMVHFYHEHGAVFGLMWVAASPAFLILIWWLRHDSLRLTDLVPSFDKGDASILMRYSGFIIYAILVQNFTQIWIRSNLESLHGWGEAGYWQAMVRMSDAYLQVFIVFFLAYLFPKFCHEKDSLKCIKIIFETYRVLVVPLLMVLLVGYFLRDYIIEVLLSSSFSPVSELFLPQMVGDFFKILAYIPGYLIIARGYTPLVMLTEPIQAVFLITLNLLFCEQYGAFGSVVAYALTYIGYFAISMLALGFYVIRARKQVV